LIQLFSLYMSPQCIVIGASAGGLEPLKEVVAQPEDNTRIESGFVYFAPPDQHFLIDDGFVAVKRGPKENGFRPSIDALFRSAAYSYGLRAIGVVLYGALNDGPSGLWSRPCTSDFDQFYIMSHNCSDC
jgi:chemotaxis response regulator CheB